MSWTERPDDQPCCGDEPGAVGQDEFVARLIHNRIEVPASAPFTREELTWHGKKVPHQNACGIADGMSVDRCNQLSDDELRSRAKEQAGAERESRGALVARVSDLRAIPSPAAPDTQVIFVYDDPMQGNAQHAVVRVTPMERPPFAFVRNELMKAFGRRVDP